MELVRCDRCKKEMMKTEEKVCMVFRTERDMCRRTENDIPIDLCMECKEKVKNYALGIEERKDINLYSEGEIVETIGEQEESKHE